MKFPAVDFSALRRELFLLGWLLLVVGAAAWVRHGRSAENHAHLGLEVVSDTSSVAQVFYDTGAGYNEHESDSQFIRKGPNQLHFSVAARAINGLRFDPLTTGGTVGIRQMWVEDPTGARRTILPLTGFQPGNQIAELRQSDTDVVIRMPAGADDPSVVRVWNPPLVLPVAPFPWLAAVSVAVGMILLIRLRASVGDLAGAGAWVVGLGVVAASVAILWPLHRTLDLPLWDEANYFRWGSRFFSTHNLGDIAGSPGYHFWYAILTLVRPGPLAVLASDYLLKILVVLGTTLVARRWLGSWIGAAMLGTLVLLSQWQLTFPLLVYDAAWVCFLAAIFVADRNRWMAIGFLLLAALTRLEYLLALGAVLGWWTLLLILGRRRDAKSTRASKPWWIGWALLPLLVAAFISWHVRGWRLGGERGWFAFQQHYAVGLADVGEMKGLNPWLEYPAVIERDFPGAHSVADAWRINRSAVFDHVGRNAARVGDEITQFFRAEFPGRWANLVPVALLLAALVGGAANTAGPATFRDWRRAHRASIAVAFSGLAAIAPGILIYAKTAYLLPIVPLIWLVVAAAGVALGARIRGAGSTAVRRIALFAAVGGLALLVLFAPRPFANLQPQPVRANLATIRKNLPVPTTLLGMCAEQYAGYLGLGYRGIEPLEVEIGGTDRAEDATLPRLIARYSPQAILVTPPWKSLGSFDQAGYEDLTNHGWRRIELEEGELFVRAEPAK